MATAQELTNQYQEAYNKAQKYNNDRTWIERSALGDFFGISAKVKQKQALLDSYMTNAYNSAEAQKNREFQEYMSNTAYQRSAKDLSALGFSPMALLSPSSSATTPSGSTASGSTAPSYGSEAGLGIISSLIKVIGILAGKPTTSNISIGSKRSYQAYEPLTSKKDLEEWENLMNLIDSQ